ncbi:DUF7144 family membrane protein [Actinocatenispora comari]|jgi:hypothetical protein|uniref:DUF7144 domain-containing protein n=1 Tax=Actinocatenispora comari TaxID=2807577 RepID=A0A8J4EP51_9ACTN|nr:hypothetical protein [Actinocatenispora comari]GIL28389.1 hypothetical protein NUM_36430 [Actinocatenispora comari]
MARSQHAGLAMAGSVFAATMMVMIGVFEAIMGVVGIVKNQFYVATNNYLFDLDTTAWGWVHLVLGVLLVLVGIALFGGAGWAAVTAIALAGLSAINNFFFLPHYPIWSIVVIAANVFVIWSLATVINSRTASRREDWQATGGGAEKWPQRNVGAPARTAADADAPSRATGGTDAPRHAATQQARDTAADAHIVPEHRADT